MNNTTSSLEQPQLLDEPVATMVEESCEPSLATPAIEEETIAETTLASTEVTKNDVVGQVLDDPMATTAEESCEPLLATPAIEEETIAEITIASTEVTKNDVVGQILDDPMATTVEVSCEPLLATPVIEEETIAETTLASTEVTKNDVVGQVLDDPMATMVEESCEPLLATPIIEEETIEETTVSTETTETTVVDQVGQLTRALHNSLRELGYDKRLQDLSAEVPEAHDKLTYIASKAEQAAERVLNATEIAIPIQDELSSESTNLSEQWKQALESQESSPDDAEKYKNLIINTLAYLDSIPKQTSATNAQLMEIMMAQDFQDLTGQVVSKVTKMVKDLQFSLLQLLVANVPEEKRIGINEGLMNGPVVNSKKQDDVVSNQEQADDLLASMGF